MIVIFYFTLDYVKINILTTFRDVLAGVMLGEVPDPTLLEKTSDHVNTVTFFVSLGTLAFAIMTGIIAAHITLQPTKRALSIQRKFISSIAHELRTPLAVIRTTNEVALYDVEKNSTAYETITDTLQQAKHLSNVLDNLLVFSRIDLNESITFTSLSVIEPITNSVSRLRELANKRGVKIETIFKPVPNINGNAAALEQAIYNIIKNAITYSKPSQGEVIITVTEKNNNVTISIADSGVGINKKHLTQIFSPFYRVNEARSESEHLGLGLTLVYDVIKMHLGTIAVESTEGTGTTFTLSFPIKNQSINLRQREQNSIEYNFNK